MKHFKDVFIDKNTGEIVCNCGCGYILEQNTADLSASDSIASDPSKRLTATHHMRINDTHHDGGLGTDIREFEFTSDNKKTQFSKLQKYSRSSSAKDHRLVRYINEIRKILNTNNFSQSLLVHCVYYLKKCEKKSLLKGKKTTMCSICIIYLTTKQIPGFNYKIKDDLKRNNLKYTSFMKYIRELKPVFIKKNIESNIDSSKHIILEKLCDEVHISMKLRIKARSILNYCTTKKLFLTANSKVWATTCIWLAIRNNENYSCHAHIPIDDLANTAGISAESIIDLKRQLLENGTLQILSLSSGIKKSIANYVHPMEKI